MFGCRVQRRGASRTDASPVDPVESRPYVGHDRGDDLVSTVDVVRPEAIPGFDKFNGTLAPIRHQDRCARGVAKPITTGRRDAEDLRSGPIVRHRLLLDRIDVPGDHPSVHVEPKLALVHAADAAQAHLALADLAVPRARGAHDLVRAFDGLPELGDLAHRLAGGLADVEDFLLRDHRPRYTARLGAKYFGLGLPNHGRTEVLPALGQERLPPVFRHEHLPAGGRHLAAAVELLAAPGARPTFQEHADRLRADRG